MKFRTLLMLAVLPWALQATAQEGFKLETDSFALQINDQARVAALIDRQSGINYAKTGAPAPFATVRKNSQTYTATAARYASGVLTLRFEGLEGEAAINVVPAHRRLTFEVVSFPWSDAEELTFGIVPLNLKGDFSEPFAVSPLALNLSTNCFQIPGLSPSLPGFTACKRFGFTGAQGAILACATGELRDALKEAVQSAPGLAATPLGGPWALDAPINQGSYLIAMDEYVTPENAAQWIEAAKAAGATQIDFHGGKAFRWGDFEVNKAIYPQGRTGLKAAVDAVHAAGMAAGLHTYAFFIDKESPWVTPVPDPRLATDATFTLAGDLAADGDTLLVAESTEAMSAVTGFQVRNSATLWLGDELITYTSVDKHPPYAFRGCVRGAYGTKAASHAKGTPAKHLKECFGLFVPQGDSTLYTEVARHTADLYNDCGFDMLYLDALDGSDILEGPRYAWHYEALFVDELLRQVKKPPVMEMSTFSHHLWRARSRMQAWDCAQRCVKAFVDCHVADNRQWKAAFFPTHLGWWGNFDWLGVQPERTYPDDLEYVCAKALATDSSLSYIVGFSPQKMALGSTQRLAAIAQRYERLRSAGTVPESIKEKLLASGKDFKLELTDDGTALFRPATYAKHSVTADSEASRLVFDNPYGVQPVRMRIEALLSPARFDAPDSQTLADPNAPEAFGKVEAQEGVAGTFAAGTPDTGAVLTAQNATAEPYRAWASVRKEFAAPADLKEKGLGLWIVGDGQGEVLNVQVRSPYAVGGGLADHYIPIDFTGRRYFELVEPESDALGTYEWAHTRRLSDMLANPRGMTAKLYPMYHIWVDYRKIESLTLGLNNVPAGKSVRVGVGPIKSLALSKGKLVNPSVTLGGRTLTFPVTLQSGSYLEFLGINDCKVYDGQGNRLGDVVPSGAVPELAQGQNALSFACDTQSGNSKRARVTLMAYGEPLQP